MSVVVDDDLIRTKPDVTPERPIQYHVLMLNDFRECVGCDIALLMDVFNMNFPTASKHVHEATVTGASVLMTSTWEVVESKIIESEDAKIEHADHNPQIFYIHFRPEAAI